MSAIAFDTLKAARRLIEAGMPPKQAEAQAEVRGSLRLIHWMLGLVILSTTVPAIHSLLLG